MIKDICTGILRKAGVDEERAQKISIDIINKRGDWDPRNYLSGTKAYFDPVDDDVTFVKPFIPSRTRKLNVNRIGPDP